MQKFKIKNGALIKIRRLKNIDFFNGFLDTLGALNPVPLTPETARVYFEKIQDLNPNTFIYIALKEEKQIIGTASLIIDQKFGGKIARLEDVTTRVGFRGLGVSSALQNVIISKAKKLGCYKIILNCKKELVNFYHKMGFEVDQRSMKIILKEKK